MADRTLARRRAGLRLGVGHRRRDLRLLPRLESLAPRPDRGPPLRVMAQAAGPMRRWPRLSVMLVIVHPRRIDGDHPGVAFMNRAQTRTILGLTAALFLGVGLTKADEPAYDHKEDVIYGRKFGT